MWSVISHAMARRAEGVDGLETGVIQEAKKMEVRRAGAGSRCYPPVGALVALVAAGHYGPIGPRPEAAVPGSLGEVDVSGSVASPRGFRSDTR